MTRTSMIVAVGLSVSVLSGMASAQLLDPHSTGGAADTSVLFTGSPRLIFEVPTIDLGAIPDTEEVRRSIEIRNDGNAPLVITQVKPGCGCTGADVDKNFLAPGDTAHLNVVYNPHGKQGKQHTAVTLWTNETGAGSKVVNIEAEVLKRIAIEPQLVNFGLVRKGESKTMTAVITARTTDFKPEEIVFSHPNIIAAKFGAVEDTQIDGKPAKTCTVELSVLNNAPVGRASPNINFKTNDEKAPTARIDIAVDVTGDLQAAPSALNLRMVKPGDAFTSEFTVTNKAAKPFKLLSGKFVPDTTNVGTHDTKVTIQPIDPTNPVSYKVVVSGVAASQNATIRGVITLITDILDEQEIKVQMYGVVREPVAARPVNGAPAGPVGPAVPIPPANTGHEGHDH